MWTDYAPSLREHSFSRGIIVGGQNSSPTATLARPLRTDRGPVSFLLAGLLHLFLYLGLCQGLPLGWRLGRAGFCHAYQDSFPMCVLDFIGTGRFCSPACTLPWETHGNCSQETLSSLPSTPLGIFRSHFLRIRSRMPKKEVSLSFLRPASRNLAFAF